MSTVDDDPCLRAMLTHALCAWPDLLGSSERAVMESIVRSVWAAGVQHGRKEALFRLGVRRGGVIWSALGSDSKWRNDGRPSCGDEPCSQV